MKYIKMLCLVIMLVFVFTACNNDSTNVQSTINSVEGSINVDSSEVDNTIYQDDVEYKNFRVFVNDSLIDRPLTKIMNEYGEDIDQSAEYIGLLKTSFPIKAYYHVDKNNEAVTGDLIIADNTNELLHNLNDFEVNEDFTNATFTSEANIRLTVKTKVNENNELVILLNDSNIAAVEFEE